MSDVPPSPPPDPGEQPGWGAPPPSAPPPSAPPPSAPPPSAPPPSAPPPSAPPPGGYGQPPEPPQAYQQYGYGYGYGVYAQYAGFWIRLLAAFVDGLIIGVPFAILASIVQDSSSAGPGFGINPGYNLGLNLASLIVSATYYGVLEGGPNGQTLGKKLCNIRVVDAETGQPGVGMGRCVGRYAMSIVSGYAIGLGYFWMLWDPKKQTWHDKVARTIVVKAQ